MVVGREEVWLLGERRCGCWERGVVVVREKVWLLGEGCGCWERRCEQ